MLTFKLPDVVAVVGLVAVVVTVVEVIIPIPVVVRFAFGVVVPIG